MGDALKPIVLPPISRHQLALYCGGSGDHNPIHVDLDFAKKFGFKDVFAHGMLSMGFLGRLVTSYAPRDRIRKLGTRFTSITWVGDVITRQRQGHGQARGERREADRPRGQVHQPERPGHAAGPRHRRRGVNTSSGETDGSDGWQGGDRHRFGPRHRQGDRAAPGARRRQGGDQRHRRGAGQGDHRRDREDGRQGGGLQRRRRQARLRRPHRQDRGRRLRRLPCRGQQRRLHLGLGHPEDERRAVVRHPRRPPDGAVPHPARLPAAFPRRPSRRSAPPASASCARS